MPGSLVKPPLAARGVQLVQTLLGFKHSVTFWLHNDSQMIKMQLYRFACSLFALLLLCLGFSQPALALPCTSTCYVSSSGNDANDGDTALLPKLTIAAAVAQVNTGGQIILAAGTYTEAVVLNKTLALSGAGIGLSTLQAPIVGTGIGISLQASGISLKDFSVTTFATGVQGPVALTSFTALRVSASSNAGEGFSFPGNVDYSNIILDTVTANNNSTGSGLRRGFWMTGFNRSNIVIRDSTFNNNNLVGIDFSGTPAAGSTTGLQILRNTLLGNGDSGIAVLAATGPAANQIHGNTVSNNGRFGIEIKLPVGNGASSGAGSFTVRDNLVSRTAAATDPRDYAGIAIFRRSNTAAGVPYAEPPSGIWVEGNTITGFTRGPAGAGGAADGIGLLLEGTGHTVVRNVIASNNVGIQIQSGGPNYPADSPSAAATLQTPFFDRGNTAAFAAANTLTLQNNSLCLNTDFGARKWEGSGGTGVTALTLPSNWWGTSTLAALGCSGVNNCISAGSAGNTSMTATSILTSSNDTFLTTNGVCNVPAAPPVACTPATPSANKLYRMSSFKVSNYLSVPLPGSPPYFTGDVPSIGLSANPNSLGINPLFPQRFYYVRAAGAGAGKVLYYDLATSTEIDPGYLTTLPVAARDGLAFSQGGVPYGYADTTGILYNVATNTLQAMGAVVGAGAPSALVTDYKISDLALDGSDLVWVVGMFPRAAPTSAHLLRLNPADGTVAYKGQLTLSPVPGTFPVASSGLAFSPNSTGAAPQLVWTSAGNGSWVVDINSLIATKTGPNSADGADLASCVFPVFVPDLTLSKSNGLSTLTVASTTTYTFTINNTGASASLGAVTLLDVLPAQLAVAAGAVPLSGPNAAQWACNASGQNIACTSTAAISQLTGSSSFALAVQVLGTATGTVTNRVQLSGGGDPNLSVPPTTTTASACSGTNTPTRGCAVDTDALQLVVNVSISKSNGTDTLIAGSTTAYTITLVNLGPSTLVNATLTDSPSAGLLCSTLSCSVSGGPPVAVCPPVLSVPLLASGMLVPSLSAGTTMSFVLTCGVTATGL
jgi:uncharacterized repeat protein (TIGR01451 family)